ncbi:MAG: hypothetical protein LBM64_07605 [Deltaproteobacteria bacterium]|jgi:hypothetical protein|nr:hypothetical protein [Deltaproteobacteria bacterium]
MPVTKPQQIFGGGGVPVIKKARQSALEQRQAMNAAMGLDNFAKLLRGDAQAAVQTVTSQQADAARAQSMALANQGGSSLQPGQLGQPGPAAAGSGPAHTFRQSLESAPGGAGGNPQNLTRLQQLMQQADDPLTLVKSLNPLSTARPQGEEGRMLARRTFGHRRKTGEAETAPEPKEAESPEKPIGALSAMFESGSRGIAAIGYDRNGGTSYGKYQISSKAGSMDQFIKFLAKEEPEFAERLKKAGPANTGGRGGKMPQVWNGLADEQPERFAELQQRFIGDTHFKPAMDKIKSQTGLEDKDFSPAMLEVVFSTAVQHGVNAAGRIIGRALETVGLDKLKSGDNKEVMRAEQEVIRGVYKNRSRQFVSSTQQVREAVQGRLQTEMNMALNMLKDFFTA